MGLAQQIQGLRVCIDTAPFIYYIEKHNTYRTIINPVFADIEAGKIDAITSTITLLEVLIHPFKMGHKRLASKYRDILLHSEGLTTYEIFHEVSEKASRLRANYSVRTPDAIQMATGIVYGADVFLTNDADLKKVPEIHVFTLEEFEKNGPDNEEHNK